MIYDKFENIGRYNLPRIADVINFIKKQDLFGLTAEEIEINGRDLFVRPSSYETRTACDGRFETHSIYADIQYVIKGKERMQIAPTGVLTPLTDYDPLKDCQFFFCRTSHHRRGGRSGLFYCVFSG